MAEYTENFNLKKPGQDDFYNIEDFNENADIIDAELKKLNDAIKDLDADGITLPDGKTISEKFEEITEEVGNIQELNTDEKANIVAAINEIYQALVAHKADYMQHTPYAIATGNDSYAVSIPGISSLVEGMSVKVKFTSANTGASTLNINGLGAKEIRKSNGNSLLAGNIKAGQICHLVYTGSVFQLLGEGGEYGTAQPNHVLEGITFGTEDGLKVGTMPNRGGVNRTLTTQGGTYVIPEGYHDGTGTVKAQFANLIASNIRKGVNIGGIVGEYVSDYYVIGNDISDMNDEITITSSGFIRVIATGIRDIRTKDYSIKRTININSADLGLNKETTIWEWRVPNDNRIHNLKVTKIGAKKYQFRCSQANNPSLPAIFIFGLE